MRFILYVRKSSEDNQKQMQSIPDQIAVLKRLAAEQGLFIAYELSEARSAKRPGTRPVFAQMLDLIRAGKADAILCWKINRLQRNSVDAGIIAYMLESGVIKCIKTPHREYWPEDNTLVLAVENAEATQYIRELRANIRRAQDEKAGRGWYPYRPRAGYLTDRTTHQIVIDPTRFPLLEKAFRLVLTGAYTIPEAHARLNRWGYRSAPRVGQSGKPMAISRFYALLHDPFYCGEFTHAGKQYAGLHQPMLSREEFDRLQRIISRPKHIQPQKQSFPFTGLIRCGRCGCLVTAERRKKIYRTTGRSVTYTYYHCSGSKGCPKDSISEAYIQAEIGHLLDRCHLDAETGAWAEAAITRDLSDDPKSAEHLLSVHENNLALLSRKVSALFDLRLGDELTVEEFATLKAKYQQEIHATRLAIERLKNWRTRRNQSAKNMFAFATAAKALFAKGGEKVKREVAVILGQDYLLTLGRLEITVNPLLQPLVTFEPPKRRQQQVRARQDVRISPRVFRLVENIRTLLEDETVSFPELKCLQQEEDSDPILDVYKSFGKLSFKPKRTQAEG